MTSGAATHPPASDGFAGDAELASDARGLLEKIASRSRFAGTENEARARELCATVLEAQGFSVSERQFTFSEFPGKYGPSVVAVLLASIALLTSYVYRRHGGAGPAILFLAIGIAVGGAIALWLARRGTSRFPWLRKTSSNLIATRGRPSVWLVAHADSKSQTIPMLARIAAVVAAAIAFSCLGVALVAAWMSVIPDPGGSIASAVSISATAAAIACIPLVLCLTGDKSAGAVDNASGLIAVLLAARELRMHPDLGVIVTSAEELGLAGARAYTESNADRAIAINCDTIDDSGRFLCMAPKSTRGVAAAAVMRAAAHLGVPTRLRGVIPGVLADSIAFANAGWDSVTVSRGNIATLARVHTSGDIRQRLDGSGIAQAAHLLAVTVTELS
jgi:acetylornithine deacetylase/succinyl-diaminopimelate desuccinylase-like protein